MWIPNSTFSAITQDYARCLESFFKALHPNVLPVPFEQPNGLDTTDGLLTIPALPLTLSLHSGIPKNISKLSQDALATSPTHLRCFGQGIRIPEEEEAATRVPSSRYPIYLVNAGSTAKLLEWIPPNLACPRQDYYFVTATDHSTVTESYNLMLWCVGDLTSPQRGHLPHVRLYVRCPGVTDVSCFPYSCQASCPSCLGIVAACTSKGDVRVFTFPTLSAYPHGLASCCTATWISQSYQQEGHHCVCVRWFIRKQSQGSLTTTTTTAAAADVFLVTGTSLGSILVWRVQPEGVEACLTCVSIGLISYGTPVTALAVQQAWPKVEHKPPQPQLRDSQDSLCLVVVSCATDRSVRFFDLWDLTFPLYKAMIMFPWVTSEIEWDVRAQPYPVLGFQDGTIRIPIFHGLPPWVWLTRSTETSLNKPCIWSVSTCLLNQVEEGTSLHQEGTFSSSSKRQKRPPTEYKVMSYASTTGDVCLCQTTANFLLPSYCRCGEKCPYCGSASNVAPKLSSWVNCGCCYDSSRAYIQHIPLLSLRALTTSLTTTTTTTTLAPVPYLLCFNSTVASSPSPASHDDNNTTHRKRGGKPNRSSSGSHSGKKSTPKKKLKRTTRSTTPTAVGTDLPPKGSSNQIQSNKKLGV